MRLPAGSSRTSCAAARTPRLSTRVFGRSTDTRGPWCSSGSAPGPNRPPARNLSARAPPRGAPRPPRLTPPQYCRPLSGEHPGAVSSAAASRRPGRLMSEKSLEKLRTLLKSYAERAGAGAGAGAGTGTGGSGGGDVKPAHDESERRRRACGDRLQKMVRPVLDRVVDELKNAGHEAAIEDQSATA